jgi:hypothetical protein
MFKETRNSVIELSLKAYVFLKSTEEDISLDILTLRLISATLCLYLIIGMLWGAIYLIGDRGARVFQWLYS